MRSFFKLWMIVAFLVLAGIIVPAISRAGTEPYENFLKGKIQKKDTLLVKDEKFKNASFNWSDITNIAVKNTITLRLIDETALTQSFHCDVDLKVQYYTSPDQDTAKVIDHVKLKVNYDKTAGASYKITDSYNFTGAYWVKITVIRVYSPELGINVPPNLQLSSNIVIDREYKFKPQDKLKTQASFVTVTPKASAAKSNSTMALKTLDAASTSANNNAQLQLMWPPVAGATEYDLEWTTADIGSNNAAIMVQMLGNSAQTDDVLNGIFRNNATRVTINGTVGYNISLMYNDDYLAVRLRAVSYNAAGIRNEGNWDYKLGTGTYAVYPISWHQPNLNWQYSASFAEEAKRKEVVSYFDGTLRGRQTVTINNSDNIPVAQENVYDEFGRPVVSILPAPFKDASGVTYLHYNQNFNLAPNGTTPYTFNNIHDNSCEIFADSVGNNSGAGQYYSINNTFKGDKAINKFIPQSEGYPLSVTQYTPDNTGRIKLQGGVGLLFQPGLNGTNASHTTKYYYGKPDQWELDQLFGNDAGYAEHYQKNMVVDPNGQISISYLNASGKTVATALAGNSPYNVLSLIANNPSFPSRAQTVHLLKPDQFVYNNSELKLTATTTYLASVTGPATFKYNIEQLVDSYPGNYGICSHCYYDLSIKVLNDCNQTIYATTTPAHIGALHDTTCTKPAPYADSVTVNTPQIGEYYVTFELALSKTAIENYVGSFILKGQQTGLIHNELSFLKSYFDKMDYSGCLSDCSTALQTLGDSTSFRNMFRSKISNTGVTVTDTVGLDKYIYAKWDSLHVVANTAWLHCDLAPCNDKQTIMEQDVSPGGQYALFDASNNPIETDINVLTLHWADVFPVKASSDPIYHQEVITRTDGSITSPYDAGFSNSDKINYWKDAWAVKFLPYHPEYCKLQFCESMSSDENWDAKVQMQNTVIDLALTISITYDNANITWLYSHDPFFNGKGSNYKADMLADLNNYSATVAGNPNVTPKTISQMVDYVLYCSDPNGNINKGTGTPTRAEDWTPCSPDPTCRIPDREWQTYKGYYFDLKQKYYQKLRDTTTCLNQCSQVGQTIVLPLDGACPLVSDFSIIQSGSSGSTNAISINYNRGRVSQPLTVNIYYPSEIDTTGLVRSVHFATGDAAKSFNISANIPVSSIHISSSVCDQSCSLADSLIGTWCYSTTTVDTYTNGSSRDTLTSSPAGSLTLNNNNTYSLVTSTTVDDRTNTSAVNGTWQVNKATCEIALTPDAGSAPTYYSLSNKVTPSATVYYSNKQPSPPKSYSDAELQVWDEDGGSYVHQKYFTESGSVYIPAGHRVYLLGYNDEAASGPSAASAKLRFIVTKNGVTVRDTTVNNVSARTVGDPNSGAQIPPYEDVVAAGDVYTLNVIGYTNDDAASVTPLTNNPANNAGNVGLVLKNRNGISGSTLYFHNCGSGDTGGNTGCANQFVLNNVARTGVDDQFYAGTGQGNLTIYQIFPQDSEPIFMCGGTMQVTGAPYDCAIIHTTTGDVTYDHCWVFECDNASIPLGSNGTGGGSAGGGSGGGGDGGGLQQQQAMVSTVALQANFATAQSAATGAATLKTNKVKKEQIAADYNTKFIYSIRSDSTETRKIPKQKNGFGSYTYRPSFLLQLDKNSYARYNNVFVAAMEPEEGSANAKKRKKKKTRTVLVTKRVTTAKGQNMMLTMAVVQSDVTIPVACSEALQYKTSRFDESNITKQNTYQGVDTATINRNSRAAVDSAITNACEGNADGWMAALSAGLKNYSPEVHAQLRAALLAVCVAGGDTAHIGGASTVPVGHLPAGIDASFGAAISRICGTFTPQLNPWLITSPAPHDPKMQAALPIISSTDPAICAKLSALHQQYPVKADLAKVLNISLEDLVVLHSSCVNCKFLLKYDMVLPVSLDSGVGCVTKTQFDQAMSDLSAAIPTLVANDNDTTYRTVYTNFLNQRWGFAMGYDQYKDFYTAAASGGSQTLCNQPPYTTTAGDPWSCIESQIAVAVSSAERIYSTYIDSLKDGYRVRYTNTCAGAKATVNLQTLQRIYQYTLYYYDQADNLVRTIPPEGVTLLGGNEQNWVDSVRNHDQIVCNYTGPATNSDKIAAITNLQTILDNTGSTAIEMWFYNGNYKALKHFVEVDPNKKYLFQGTISRDTIGFDIYPLTNSATSAITFSPTSLHYRAAVPAAMMPLPPWVHLVIQGPALGTNTALPQIFVSGTPLTVTNTPTPMDGGWTVTATAAGMIYPDSMQTLKHLRLYTRLMTPAEITVNANDNCLLPSNSSQMAWYRFNVPPPGSTTTIADNSTVETQRSPIYPLHNLATTYAYNSTNQVIHQNTPDGGNTNYWYDLLSRLTASQNDKQLGNGNNTYSYTTYDNLGRIIEVGQKQGATIAAAPDYVDSTAVSDFLVSGNNTQITRTYYDNNALYASGMLTTATYANLVQNNLRKRVAASVYLDNPTTLVSGLYYNYDLDGNLKTLYRQIPVLGTKQIHYEYDLISGKVNFVAYQPTQPDQFYYSYAYDADNRITEAWSSPLANVVSYGRGSTLDYTRKRMDAQYYYYPHGPLARMELGDVASGKVQGVDYAYTLQGWLKGVNGTAPDMHTDMGADGATVAKDAYGYALQYTRTDYKPVGGASPFDGVAFLNLNFLFNGNIAGSSVMIPQLGNYRQDYKYFYDQLNRLMVTNIIRVNSSGQVSSTAENTELFGYDGNGNLQFASRNANDRALEYQYKKDGDGHLLTNRLNGINVSVGNTYNNTGDLSANTTYTYDPIGNLLTDSGEGITNVDWSVYGKIQNIYKSTGNINYKYDPAGNRQSKTYKGLTTYYVRDAQGNTLAVYDDKNTQINWREQHLYGSSRIGIWTPNVTLLNNNALAVWDTIGRKQYELTNHLGNVMATVSDLRTLNGTTYQPTVLNAQDYYAFGMVEPNRSYTSGGNYRYGFNGKENDNEVKGAGNQQDYGMRIYDPRVGRFLSVDPLTKNYPWYAGYQFAGDNPVLYNDLDGMEELQPDPYHVNMALAPTTYKSVSGRVVKTTYTLHGWPRNYLYYWDKVLENDPNALDPTNAYRVRNLGLAPKVTSALKNHLLSKGFDIIGLEDGETMIHHHINAGSNAVAIGESNHREIPTETSGFRFSGRAALDRLRGANDVLSIFGLVLDIFNDNPHSTGMLFSAGTRMNTLYFDIESKKYYSITKGSIVKDNDGNLISSTVTYDYYNDYDYDKKTKKYIGIGKIGTKIETYNAKTGKTTTSSTEEQ